MSTASLPPRSRRKTAKAAAESISKALGPTEEDADSGEEYKPSQAGRKYALSAETAEYLKNWMLSPDHIDNPYPTEEEKIEIMRHCGIGRKQLTNWFVNNRKRIWRPKLEELKRSGVAVAVVSETERVVKKKKTVNKRQQETNVMPDLPPLFNNRHDQISEYDDGTAATEFNIALPTYEHDAEGIEYKNSDAVQEFSYFNNYRSGGAGAAWEERQRQRDLESPQIGAYSTESTSQSTAATQAATKANDDDGDGALSPETALVQIATYSLEKMTKSLEGKKDVAIPVKERTEFANALKGAMDALAKIA